MTLHDFDNCRNTESGAVFIIASGMSAKSFPLEQFAHVPMITMNGAISMFLGTDIKPCFYACTDDSFSEQQPELFKYAMAVSQNVALWEDHWPWTAGTALLKGECLTSVRDLPKARRSG